MKHRKLFEQTMERLYPQRFNFDLYDDTDEYDYDYTTFAYDGFVAALVLHDELVAALEYIEANPSDNPAGIAANALARARWEA